MFLKRFFPMAVVSIFLLIVLSLPGRASADVGWSWKDATAGKVKAQTSMDWVSIASSEDGSHVAAVPSDGGPVYTSTDYGATWTARTASGSRAWSAIASSTDGSHLAAVVGSTYNSPDGDVFTSTDYGATWSGQLVGQYGGWLSIASSGDGESLAVVATGGYVYTSPDGGGSWVQQTGSGTYGHSHYWQHIASSSDGKYLFATAVFDENTVVSISPDAGLTWSDSTLTGVDGNTARLSIVSSSDGKYLAVSGSGDIQTSSDYGATWQDQAGSGNRYWSSIASSGDGSHLVAAVGADGIGGIYVSSNYGVDWSTNSSMAAEYWGPVASSSNGSHLVAGVNGGTMYTSSDYGATWTVQHVVIDANVHWTSITSSADGTYLAGVISGGDIWTSSDSGATWVERASAGCRTWASIASSSDGRNLVAVAGGDITPNSAGTPTLAYFGPAGPSEQSGVFHIQSNGNNGYDKMGIYVSHDWGATWTEVPGTSNMGWSSVTSSADGVHLAATNGGHDIWTSSDGGTAWRDRGASSGLGNLEYWTSIASSSDGMRLIAVEYYGDVYISTNGGASWTLQTSLQYTASWSSVASSADGSHLAVASSNGDIYTSPDSGATWTGQTSSGINKWSSITSSADGMYLAASVYGGDVYLSADGGGTWDDQVAGGSRQWTALASSADGTKLAAVVNGGDVFTSSTTNPWKVSMSNTGEQWSSIAASADGTRIAATSYDGDIYTSADGGGTWTERPDAGQRQWISIVSSADGMKLAAVEDYGDLHTSTDGGATWTDQTGTGITSWYSIASSADGMKLAAVTDGIVCTSTDGGVTWPNDQCTVPAEDYYLNSIASSYDGMSLATTDVYGGDIYTSTDGGATWADRQSAGPRSWSAVAASPDGSQLAAAADGDYVYLSSDYGLSWVPQTVPGGHTWGGVAYFYYGSRIAAAVGSCQDFDCSDVGDIWTAGAYQITNGGSGGSGTPPAGSPTVTTDQATEVAGSTAIMNGSITDAGSSNATVRGFDWGTTSSYGSETSASGSFGTGAFYIALSSLACGTTYHYEAYATNAAGTAYGSDVSFTTDACGSVGGPSPVGSPTLSTDQATGITASSATLNATITDTPSTVTIRGFNWGTSDAYGQQAIQTGSFAAGSFSSTLSSVSCGTTYYYQAYAVNAAGTGYGNEGSFTTTSCGGTGGGGSTSTAPTVSTGQASAVAATSVTLNGIVANVGSGNVTTRGFQYGTTASYGSERTESGSFASGAFSAGVSLLACGTTYHFEAYATNAAGTSHGTDATVTTLSCGGPLPEGSPTVTAGTASSISATSATLNATITDVGSGDATTRGFQYGTTASYGSESAESGDFSAGDFTASISGLTCNTLYYFQAYATNGSGTSYSDGATFTTASCGSTNGLAPAIETYSARNVTDTAAEIDSYIDYVGSSDVSVRGIYWGLTNSYGSTVSQAGDFSYGTFVINLTSLACGTTYHYQAFATNDYGTGYSPDLSFTTNACAGTGGAGSYWPSVSTDPATSISDSSTIVNGSISDPGAENATVRGFMYGPTPSYGSDISSTGDFAGGEFSAYLSSLPCGTTYHYEAYAANDYGTGYGGDQAFITASCGGAAPDGAPTVVTGGASSVTGFSATLSGTVQDVGSSDVATRGFQYGTTPSYGSELSESGDFTAGGFSLDLSSLACGTTYHYAAYAANDSGPGYGNDATFTTADCGSSGGVPTVTTDQTSALSDVSATMNGTVTVVGSGNVTSRGFYWAPDNIFYNPSAYGSSFGRLGRQNAETGSFTAGAFSAAVASLTCGTTYHYEAYATNASGTSYGSIQSFTTADCAAGDLPAVRTDTPYEGSGMFEFAGTLVSTGSSSVTAYGFNWGTTTGYGSTTTDTGSIYNGTTGDYTHYQYGMPCGTTYHYQAYATNASGTSYGNDMTMATTACTGNWSGPGTLFPEGAPSVVTGIASAISGTSAALSGSITDVGSGDATSRGFLFGTSPTSYYFLVSDSGSFTAGTFTNGIGSLTCNTRYYYMAFAANDSGTAYGNSATFLTGACPATLPSVSTGSGSVDPDGTVEISAYMSDPGNPAATIRGFEFGDTTDYGMRTAETGLFSQGSFTVGVSSMPCGMTYHFQAYASNAAGTAYGGDSTLTTEDCGNVPGPAVMTGLASSVMKTFAVLNGSVLGTGSGDAMVRGFMFGMTTSYGADTSETGDFTFGAFSAGMPALTCGTTYHYQAYAVNDHGTGYGGDKIFTTASCGSVDGPSPYGSPVVTTGFPTSILDTSAVFNGVIADIGSGNSTVRGFQYGTNDSYGQITTENGDFGTGAFSAPVVSLACGTTYHYRAYATNPTGTGYGTDESFATANCGGGSGGVSPTVSTDRASAISGTSVVLNGSIVDIGSSDVTTRGFGFGPTDTFSYFTSESGDFSSASSFNVGISELTCGTTYYYEAYARNASGTTYGDTSSFATSDCGNTGGSAPTVLTGAASSISSTSAALNGSVSSNGSSNVTVRGFYWGLTTPYSSETTPETGDFSSPASFTANLSSLTCGTTYYYEAYATNASGTSTGTGSSFTTAGCGTSGGGTGGSGGGGSGGSSGGSSGSLNPFNSLLLDNAPTPPFSFVINGGSATTSSPKVSLALGAGADTKSISLSNTQDFGSSPVQPMATQVPWNLCWQSAVSQQPVECAYGKKTVYVKFIGSSGISTVAFTASIDYEPAGSIAAPALPGAAAGSPGTFHSGDLVNDHGTIYFIEGKTKVPFTTMKAFTGLGYSLKNVVKGDASAYSLDDTGYMLKSATQAHPYGAWVLSKRTVFFVTPTGLAGIPSWAVFLANGGKNQYIVNANKADLAVPRVAALQSNDPRVQ